MEAPRAPGSNDPSKLSKTYSVVPYWWVFHTSEQEKANMKLEEVPLGRGNKCPIFVASRDIEKHEKLMFFKQAEKTEDLRTRVDREKAEQDADNQS